MSVEFEPVKLGPRRRRIDPVLLGAIVVAIGLVAAVVKPWSTDIGPGNGGAGAGAGIVSSVPSPNGTRSTPPAVSPSPSLPRILQRVTTATSASWDAVRPAVRPHDAWGIRAIVAEPPADLALVSEPRFAEIWDALPGVATLMPSIDIEPNDRTVVAIGVTFPASHTPIDARVWLVRPDRLDWVDTEALDASPSGGGFLYRVLGADGSVQNWSAGRYRIDFLVDGAVRRVGFTLPNRFEIVPDRAEPPIVPADLIDPAGGALPDLPVGLFVTAAGVSIPLRAESGPPLTEAEAWLNVDPGTGRAPRSYVASAFAPAATGIGVTLPPGSTVLRSALRRLAPDRIPATPELVADDATAPRPLAHVLYRAPGGGVWSSGVYRVTVAWRDSSGRHDRSWHLELRPGPVRELPSMLLAARGFARYAGSTGVVVGTAEPLEGGPRSVAIRLLRAGQGSGTGIPARDLVPCDGVRVDGLAGVVGVAQPVDASPSTVTARVLYEFSRSEEQPILTAGGDVPGLILVAPAGDAALTSTVYRLRVGDDPLMPGTTVCLWTTPAN